MVRFAINRIAQAIACASDPEKAGAMLDAAG
jgi:hypothetical protein